MEERKENAHKAAGEIEAQRAILEILDYDMFGFQSLGEEDNAQSVTEKAASLLNMSGRKKPEITIQKGFKGMEGGGIKEGTIVVQYNPSSIRLNGRNKGPDKEKETGTESVKMITASGTVDMTVELVFCRKCENDTSVGEQMRLIIKMIRYSPTRKVSFSWGKLNITGKVTSFSGQYDMFDRNAVPISGKINLTIQSDISAENVSKIMKKDIKGRLDKVVEAT